MPKTDDPNSLLGPDVNKNLVRDDVEHFIYEKITKDPGLFRAYMKFAAQHTRYMLAVTVEDIKKEFELAMKMAACVSMFIPGPQKFMQNEIRVAKKITDTDARKNKVKLNEGQLPTFFKMTSDEIKNQNDNMKKNVCI